MNASRDYITVGELIKLLKEFKSDSPIRLRHEDYSEKDNILFVEKVSGEVLHFNGDWHQKGISVNIVYRR